MTRKNSLNAIKRRSCLSLVAHGLGTAALLLGTAVSSVAEEPLISNVGRFQIPFDVEGEQGQPVVGFAVLFGSQDGGTNWEQLQSVPASQKSFMFAAPRDGRYSFAIRITDAQGNLQSSIQGSPPELDVVVDTVAPMLRLELFEAGPGQVLVNWTSTDSSVAPESLAIEYADGTDGRWRPVAFRAAASGQAMIPASGGSVVSVRAAIMDAAGNRVEAASQIVTRAIAPLPLNGTQPSWSQQQAMPLGPSPFGPPSVPTRSGAVFDRNPGGGALPPGPVAVYSDMTAASTFGAAPMLTGAAVMPQVPVMHPSAGYGNSADIQLVNNRVFDLDYQVEDVGPSGVSAVELFVTENGGQQWFRYGNDDDLHSPFSVDAQSEGTYGFAVRIRNGLGFADDPPQPGQAPEIVVTVDTTAPMIELAQPTVHSDGFGTIQLAWRVDDQHPTATPVRLEHSTTPNGPWTPVFDWQADQAGHQWAVRPGTPSLLYFRLLARDAAGNVASAQTEQPVIIDLKKPIGRLLRVHAASHAASPAY